MVVARKYVVKNYFNGPPTRADYEIVTETLPPLQPGEILVKTEWIGLDPYLRLYNDPQKRAVPYDQFGFQVGIVEESKDPKYPVGSRIVSHKGWRDYTIINMSAPYPIVQERCYPLPDLKGLSPSLGVGAVGMAGASAYLAFMDIGKPKPGETVVVTGAAGCVGLVVGQLAKAKGCKVIGFAGSDSKVEELKKLGFDYAFNYKTDDIAKSLSEAAPEGVDIYLDNVGGQISSIIIYQMREFGRVAVVGSISSYDCKPDQLPKVTLLQPPVQGKSLTIQGFRIWNFIDRWQEAFDELVPMIKSGAMKTPEHITEGFENVFDAFLNMFKGENFGKAVVKV